MPDIDDDLYLSWKGQVTGPFTLDQLRKQLRQRRINSLHKVQVDGQWIPLRDLLAEQTRSDRKGRPQDQLTGALESGAHSARPTPNSTSQAIGEVLSYGSDSSEPTISDGSDAAQELAGQRDLVLAGSSHPDAVARGRGLGTAAFVLSIFFFIPFLNLFTIVLSLVFGHLSLRGGFSPEGSRQTPLPWYAVWSSYVHACFFLLGFIWLAALEQPGTAPELFLSRFFELHGMMLGNAIAACLGAGLLMLAVKMLASYLPPFHLTYVAALLPISVGNIASVFISLGEFANFRDLLITYGIAHAIMLLIEIIFWAGMIQNKDGKPLGYGHAAVASLFYNIVSFFLVFVVALGIGAVRQ